jgi:hypothetical protein
MLSADEAAILLLRIHHVDKEKTRQCIERLLLKTRIADYRKNAIFWILAPYLITIKKKLDYQQVHNSIMDWLDGCAGVTRLEPSVK